MGPILHGILSALSMAFAMFWEILWPLILGFSLSGLVQAVVSKRGAFARRFSTFTCNCMRAGRGFLIVFICCRCAGALPFSKGRELHRRHGFRACINQSGR